MSRRIALLGQPNSGKSTVYNALTGAHQHVGNWPGKTVERNDGYYTYDGTKYTVTDLPGSYGLTGNSDEEIITSEYIKENNADLVCVLVDASQLERSMYMLAEFAALKKPAVLLLNMMDVAKQQKKQIDHKLLEKRLGIPVLPFTAAEQKGYEELKKLLASELKKTHTLASVPEVVKGGTVAESDAKYKWISEILKDVTKASTAKYEVSKFDKAALHPVGGKLISIGVVLLAFLGAMVIMAPFMAVGSMLPGLLNQPIHDLLNPQNSK